MPTTQLSRSRKKLKTMAGTAAKLALSERLLADQQHVVAHDLELLADELAVRVAEVEAEIRAVGIEESKSAAE